MKLQRIDEYHKHGCNFYGKLVLVDYSEDMQADPRWGQFNSGVSLDYMVKAQNMVKERYGNYETLLSIPDLVIRLKD